MNIQKSELELEISSRAARVYIAAPEEGAFLKKALK
jgi:hypothetical protein